MKYTFHFFTACAFTALFLFGSTQKASAQNSNPLNFEVTFSKEKVDLGDTVEIIFKAKVPKGWHVYGVKSDCPADDGPLRAEITLDSGNFKILGPVTEAGGHAVKDEEVWKCTTTEFSGECEFRVKILVTGSFAGLTAHFYGQKCSDADGMCLMVKEVIPIPLKVTHSRPFNPAQPPVKK